MTKVGGIHHITAIASDPQRCYDFYSKILGLRLVKKSVNQDDTATYHLFFGDKVGSPGMDLTFFTFSPAYQGKRGAGVVSTISLAIPAGSLDFWLKRFEKKKVKHDTVVTEFGHKRVFFYDEDDQRLELVEVSEKELQIVQRYIWTTKEISHKEAIRSLFSATLNVLQLELIDDVFTTMGYELAEKNEQSALYALPTSAKAAFIQVDINQLQEPAIGAAGTVHHIAFQVKDEAQELEMRRKIFELGLYPTEVIDRYYFRSVYFRTKAGILFELATLGPGFTADEEESVLGEKLALPPFLEDQRAAIEAGLSRITM